MMMNKKQLTLKLSAITVSILLASCGGGGDGYYGSSSSSSGSGTGTTPVAAVKISDISLTNSDGGATSTIAASGTNASVTVTDASGKPIKDALVTFTSTGEANFGTSNGAVLTNANGIATISVTPVNSTDSGAYILTATASANEVSATVSKNITFTAANIKVALTGADSSLTSGGSTLLTAVTTDLNTGKYQNGVVVTFSAECGTFSNNNVTSSSQGNISTTYYAITSDGKLCSGEQKIIATPTSGTAGSFTANIAAATATSIAYTKTSDVVLGVKGSGTSSSGQITFTVYSSGAVLANQDVVLSLEKAPSDFSFVTSGNRATTTVKSDSSGKVTVNLYPGYKSGPVEVKAALASDSNTYALAKNVTVTTGRATQNSFSLSATKNSLHNDVDGDVAVITAMLADRLGNSVPDGTTINFVAEGGKIDGYCTTLDGKCSVQLRTQNPRPANGRITVLAYAEGDKAYQDVDSDNVYTAGVDKLLTFTDTNNDNIDDTWINSNVGDFFIDWDENLTYTTGEYKYTRVITGSSAICAASTINQPNISGTCDNDLATTLRQQMLFSFASSTPTVVSLNNVNFSTSEITANNFSFQLFGNSAKTVPLPSDSTITVSAKDNTDNNLGCTAEISSGSVTVPSVMNLLKPTTFPVTSNGLTIYGVKLSKCASGDDVKVTVSVPAATNGSGGTVTSYLLTYNP